MEENLVSIAFVAAATADSLLTSQAMASAGGPIAVAVASAVALSRSTHATLAPASANASEIARPMPLPAPVTTADLPSSEYFPASAIGKPMKPQEPQCGQGKPPARAD